jgi:predicted ATPase/DNA-binding winged helix-turn-helix (wHTH) protein
MMKPAQATDEVSFGPFHLTPSERLLTRDGSPLDLGARTLDTLIALVSRANEIVGTRELLALVWPDVIVEEGSLRFHIAALRKALGDGVDGARYITTVAGRGYCFVAPISRLEARSVGPIAPAGLPCANLPSRLTRMVGRADDVAAVAGQVLAARFVTILGTGGVGKTTVAVAVGHDLIGAFDGAVLFVDLGMVSDPGLVATAIAALLGLSVQSDDATPSLVAYLADKRILLTLDTCEHLIEAVATLASRLFVAAPGVHILVTSREALRVEGEQVYKLAPLACPPDGPGLTAAAARGYPAAELFVERAAASGARLALCDAEAAIIADICRKLDGVALAIELAAGRVEAYGLEQTAALLDRRLALLLPGQRTAPPRQRTLQATLDWSYGLLPELERTVLRRLAIFAAHFTIEAALAIVPDETVDEALVFPAIDSLIAKSMVATRPVGAMMRYRLLDTTRAYALALSADDPGFAALAARHATYYRQWLEQAGFDWPNLTSAAERVPHTAGIANVRAALEWCFGETGNVAIGIGLAAAAAPVFLVMSLLPECHRWSRRALLALDEATRGSSAEMHLQAAFGLTAMVLHDESEPAGAALNRALAIAEAQGDSAGDGLRPVFELFTGGTDRADRQAAMHLLESLGYGLKT